MIKLISFSDDEPDYEEVMIRERIIDLKMESTGYDRFMASNIVDG